MQPATRSRYVRFMTIIRLRAMTQSAVRPALALATGVLLVACGGSDSSDDGDVEQPERGANNDSSTEEQSVDVAAGDGFIGSGVLSITLEDGQSFEFTGDCEIVTDSTWRHRFAFDDPDAGQLASAAHTESLDDTEIGLPTSLQFSDADSWLYRGTEFTNTARTETGWSSDVVVEGAIDNEPFRHVGSVTSSCS